VIRRVRKLRRDARGAAAIEFALVAPALILFIIGIAQIGILFMANAGLTHAVAEGARLATIFPRPTDAEIRAQIADSRFGLNPANLSTPTITHGTQDGASYADISASYTVPIDFIFFTLPPLTLTETRRAYVQPVVTT
jgi:Flp pilus assembly protein TadG